MNLSDRLKNAFHQVRAEESLKENTKAFLAKKTNGYTTKKVVHHKMMIPAIVCLCLFIIGGAWFCFTPITQISIDVNPSLELAVNRFNRVISVEGKNEDGKELADTLDLFYLDYDTAVMKVLESEMVTTLVSEDELVEITVIGKEGTRTNSMLLKLQDCTGRQKNTCCYFTRSEDVKAAHEMGLSYGKYRAYLELKALDSTIKPEDVQGMTMREIRDLIYTLSKENKVQSDKWHGNHGHGNRKENANRK